MDTMYWIPSIVTLLLLLVLWFSRNFIAALVAKGLEHKFNARLEEIRAELREKEELLRADLRTRESEISALRSGAITAMASRQIALDRRRIEAVDQLWSAVTALAPVRGCAYLLGVMDAGAAADEAKRNPRFRETLGSLGGNVDPDKILSKEGAAARPYVTPMAWALFSAYLTIIAQAVIRTKIMMLGVGENNFSNNEAISKLIKSALPDRESWIDKVGEVGYHSFLEELENRLLDEIRRMLASSESDQESVAQAAEILRLADDLSSSKRRSDLPQSSG